jgi:hypothetical protein
MTVIINQAEREMLNKLPEAQRASVEAALLAAKQESQAGVIARREVFTVTISETVKDDKGNLKPGKGGVKVTGLGSRFPTTLYPEQWEIVFANMDKIRACYNDPTNKALIEKLRK